MNVLKELNFWYWVVIIVCGIVCLVSDFTINPVCFLFVAIAGFLECINEAIKTAD